MKSIKQIRTQYDLITETYESEEHKLLALAKAGLIDENKLPILKRALDEDTKILTVQEKNALVDLVESLIAEASIPDKEKTFAKELTKAPTAMSTMPSILILKRKAIRVYPGGQNVGLYYSQQLDKYVAVPFNSSDKLNDKTVLSINEEVDQLNEISDKLKSDTFAKRHAAFINSAKAGSDDAEKHFKKATKDGLNIVSAHVRKHGIGSAAGATKKLLKKSEKYYKSQKTAKETAAQKPKEEKPNTATTPTQTGKFNPLNPRRKAAQGLANNTTPTSSSSSEKKKGKQNPDMSFTQRHRAHLVAGLKRKKSDDRNDLIKKDKEMRGTNIAGDILHHAGDSPGVAIGHVIGKALYRLKKPMTEANVEEGVMDTLKSVGNSALNAAKATISGGGSGSGSKKKKSEEKRYVKTDQQSRLKITTSGVSNDRDRRYQRTISQPLASAKQVQETMEIDLDGNKFLLNTSVANKVLSVYRTLNEENRRKMIEKMNEGDESLNKVITFAVRH